MIPLSTGLILLLQLSDTRNVAQSQGVPEFKCSEVPFPDQAGSYASADPSPLHQVYVEERQHGFKEGTVYVGLSFDVSGTVVSASISRSAGNRNIDLAALNWAFCTKIKPGKAQNSTIPVMFRW